MTVAGRSCAFSAIAYRLLMDAVTSCSLRSTWAHTASGDFHAAGGAGMRRQRDLLVAFDQVVDDALRVQQFVSGLLLHPGGKAGQVVGRQPDRHRQILVRRAELELEVLVEAFQQCCVHAPIVHDTGRPHQLSTAP